MEDLVTVLLSFWLLAFFWETCTSTGGDWDLSVKHRAMKSRSINAITVLGLLS